MSAVTDQNLLVLKAMVERPNGVSVKEVTDHFGWKHETVVARMSNLRTAHGMVLRRARKRYIAVLPEVVLPKITGRIVFEDGIAPPMEHFLKDMGVGQSFVLEPWMNDKDVEAYGVSVGWTMVFSFVEGEKIRCWRMS